MNFKVSIWKHDKYITIEPNILLFTWSSKKFSAQNSKNPERKILSVYPVPSTILDYKRYERKYMTHSQAPYNFIL